MKVEIWSDVVCPWCYIGKRRFERALEGFDGAAGVEVEWRSFQLNPAHPVGKREPLEASLAAKMGRTIAQVREMNDNVTHLAALEGLEYHLERYQVVNTFDAHRLAHLGKSLAIGPEVHERLLRAQLVEGEVLDEPETLVRLGEEVGIPAADARAMLGSDAVTNFFTISISFLPVSAGAPTCFHRQEEIAHHAHMATEKTSEPMIIGELHAYVLPAQLNASSSGTAATTRSEAPT